MADLRSKVAEGEAGLVDWLQCPTMVRGSSVAGNFGSSPLPPRAPFPQPAPPPRRRGSSPFPHKHSRPHHPFPPFPPPAMPPCLRLTSVPSKPSTRSRRGA